MAKEGLPVQIVKDGIQVVVTTNNVNNVLDAATGRTTLHYATESGSVGDVQQIIALKADIDKQMVDGRSPLWLAFAKDFGIAHYLMSIGANINILRDNCLSLLHTYSSYIGCEYEIKILIENRADVNLHSGDVSSTPLHQAAFHKSFGAAKLLVQSGANIHAHNELDQTPLHIAADQAVLDVAEYLINCQADIKCRDSLGNAPLFYAAGAGCLPLIELLVSLRADINVKNLKLSTLIHASASGGHLDVVHYLTEAKVDIHARDDMQCTPLHIAANKGRLSVVQFLVAQRADIHAGDVNGMTPLIHAANRGYLDLIQPLIEQRADIHARDVNGMTPLHHAANVGHLSMVKSLVLLRANVNSQDKWGATPLHHAILMCSKNGQSTETAKYLASLKDASLDIKGANGHNALRLIADCENPVVVNDLLEGISFRYHPAVEVRDAALADAKIDIAPDAALPNYHSLFPLGGDVPADAAHLG